MHKTVSLFTLTAAIVVAAWWWLGAAVAMPPSPLDPRREALLRFLCAVPRRAEPARSLHQDRALADRAGSRAIVADRPIASAPIRSTSASTGSRDRAKVMGSRCCSDCGCRATPTAPNTRSTPAVALAKRYPDVIRAVIVGNEVLLRGEVSPETLAETIRSVKSQVPMPVTYADVWEFWLRHRELASAVDFVTIHILPYWEDDPIAAERCRRAMSMRSASGWSRLSRQGDRDRRGRLAERRPHARGRAAVAGQSGARPRTTCSRAASARISASIVIEAFDQPWKRVLRGHGRRPLGPARRRHARAEIRLGRAGLEPSALAAGRPAGGVALAALGVRRAGELARRRTRAEPRRDRACAPGARLRWWRRSPACWRDGPSRTCRSKASASAAGCVRCALAAVAIAAPIVGAAALWRCRSQRRASLT